MVIKAVLCSVVLVLLTGSGAFGLTVQDQIFNVGSANVVNLTEGIQSGQSTQNLVIDLSQVTDGAHLAATNVQVTGQIGQGGLLGTSGLLGIGSLGTQPMLISPLLLGSGSLMTSHTSTSLLTAQTRARLLGLGLMGF